MRLGLEAQLGWLAGPAQLHVVFLARPLRRARIDEVGKLRQRIAQIAVDLALIDFQRVEPIGDGALRLTRLQRAGKSAMAAADFLRGTRVPVGTNFLP